MRRIEPFFPRSHGAPRVDDQRVISGIVYVIRKGLQWKDAPRGYGPHKTLYSRFVRWSRLGVSDRIFVALAGQAGAPEGVMLDSTHLKAHRTAPACSKVGAFPRCIGRTTGGLNCKLHGVCDGQGRPIDLMLSEGQLSGHRGARLKLPNLPGSARELIPGRGYDSNSFRAALIEPGITPCIRPTGSRKVRRGLAGRM